MFLTGFPAAAFGTNCYVVAVDEGEECLIVDPGIGVLDTLTQVLHEHRLRPAAVLLTHGHADHVYSVTPVCGSFGIAASIHSGDAYRLRDPLDLLDPSLRLALEQQFPGERWREPDDVVLLGHGQHLTVAGVEVQVVHAPGHTEGSVMFSLPGVPEAVGADAKLSATLLSGDVLFAGSIGRTDLPGGDGEVMMRSLRDRVLPLADDVLVLPGHGPATTIGRERESNPFLRQVMVA